MKKITFEEYERKKQLFSPYSDYANLIKKQEGEFFKIPSEKIHGEDELPARMPSRSIPGELSSLSGPCLVLMSDGTEYGTYIDVSCYYSYGDAEWYFSCGAFGSVPLYKAYRREPTVLKWVQLRNVYRLADFTEKTFKMRDGYYEIV